MYKYYKQILQNALKGFVGFCRQNPGDNIRFVKQVSNKTIFFCNKKEKKRNMFY